MPFRGSSPVFYPTRGIFHVVYQNPPTCSHLLMYNDYNFRSHHHSFALAIQLCKQALFSNMTDQSLDITMTNTANTITNTTTTMATSAPAQNTSTNSTSTTTTAGECKLQHSRELCYEIADVINRLYIRCFNFDSASLCSSVVFRRCGAHSSASDRHPSDNTTSCAFGSV